MQSGRQVTRHRGSGAKRFATAGLLCGILALAGIGAAQQTAPDAKPASAPEQNTPADGKKAETTPPPGAAGDPKKAGDVKDVKGGKAITPVPGLDVKAGVPTYETIQEDWSSLKIGVSNLKPEAPLVAQTDEGPTFTRSLVQLQWRPGDPLDVYVILPKGVKNPPPAVLYLYGYKEDTARFRNDAWCARVTNGGVAAVGFVSALSASRFHDRPMRQWFVSELQESLGSTVHDVQFLLDYLATRGDIDMNRIGMFGQGSGATIAILAAAADPRIKAVDALDPWGDWPVWLAKSPVVLQDTAPENFTKPAFLESVAGLDPVKWLPELKSTRMRVQQIAESTDTPLECKNALRQAAPKQAQVVRFKNQQEMYDSEGGGVLFAWMRTQLETLPPSPVPPKEEVMTQAAPQSPQGSPAKR